MNAPRALWDFTLDELTAALGSRTRALRALSWVYSQAPLGPDVPQSMPEVSHRTWTPFSQTVSCRLPQVTERHEAEDGTTKYALRVGEATVETVRIPAKGRSTVCVSSQAGCTRKCAFCATQTLGFTRHLSAAEIVAQYLVARAEAPTHAPARNVVFMGMGEPMDNLDAVLRAVELLTQAPAPQLGAAQVTVSTSGVLPGMQRFLKESKASLALSLNATTDETRAAIMPHTKTWPIADLLGALRDDRAVHPTREHFMEYVMLDGVNDTVADADRLAVLLDGLAARVNLIPHNPFPGNSLRPPPHERVMAFQKRVASRGVLCLIRWPRGRDIAAACGQLVLAKSAQGFSPALSERST